MVHRTVQVSPQFSRAVGDDDRVAMFDCGVKPQLRALNIADLASIQEGEAGPPGQVIEPCDLEPAELVEIGKARIG